MIEKIILDHLNGILPVPCYMEMPDDPPERPSQHGSRHPKRYVLIEKTGSSRSNHVCNALIVVQSYAESLYEAAALNEAAKAAMDRLIELDSITRAELNSDYNYTDPVKKQYRYQAVYDVTHYEERGKTNG